MSGDAVSTKMFLLEDGEIFGPSLSISGENNSNENTTEKDGIVALPDDDLFNNPEECGDEISVGLATYRLGVHYETGQGEAFEDSRALFAS